MTNKKQSSEKMSSTAGRIMAMANQGGPMKVLQCELRKALEGTTFTADRRIEQIGEVLKPFIDDAESLAASVLAQSR